MSLILKTDVKYTGVITARHILELLQEVSEKTSYIKSMLAEIGADSSYVTNATSPTITTKLLDHVKLVQKAGATVLSMQYTVKAIVFVLKNNLADDSYSCFSPDFGVSYFPNGDIDKVYGLAGNTGSELAGYPFKLGSTNNNNILVAASTAVAGIVRSNKALKVSSGIIMGTCYKLDVTTSGLISLLRLLNAADTREYLAPELMAAITSSTSTIGMHIAKGGATTKGTLRSAGGNPVDFLNLAGVVGKIEYNTNLNKIYVNGAELRSDSGDETMFDLSSYSIKTHASMGANTTGFLEQWVINSKSDTLAQALSNHLNRQ